MEVPETERAKFTNFAPIFMNTPVSKIDIGDLLKTYVEEKGKCFNLGKCGFKLYITKRYTDHSSTFILSATGARVYKNTPLRLVRSKEIFQQFCAVTTGLRKTRN